MRSCCRNTLEFEALLARWDLRGDGIPFDELKEEIGRLDLSRADFEDHIRFDDERYQRSVVHRTPSYEVLVICWRSGQRSLIHDHAGSACVLRILEGCATETSFAWSSHGQLRPVQKHCAEAGALCASYDSDIHQIANLEPAGTDLVTLHIYSPPLSRMRTYSAADTTFVPFAPQTAAHHGAGLTPMIAPSLGPAPHELVAFSGS